jgi:DHA2 family multidrug resistance protein
MPPITARALIGFFAMAFGMFMAILDIQIVSASLAQIQAGLSASAEEISWVQTSYLIAEVVMIPLSGFLSRLLSTRILFVLSSASFTVMSLFCAMSTSIEQMIIFRALQGFLGGAMIPTVMAGSYIMFGRGRAAGVSVFVGLIATLAPTVGPTLGGILTSAFSWHWLFLINIPIGIIITAIVLFADLMPIVICTSGKPWTYMTSEEVAEGLIKLLRVSRRLRSRSVLIPTSCIRHINRS